MGYETPLSREKPGNLISSRRRHKEGNAWNANAVEKHLRNGMQNRSKLFAARVEIKARGILLNLFSLRLFPSPLLFLLLFIQIHSNLAHTFDRSVYQSFPSCENCEKFFFFEEQDFPRVAHSLSLGYIFYTRTVFLTNFSALLKICQKISYTKNREKKICWKFKMKDRILSILC